MSFSWPADLKRPRPLAKGERSEGHLKSISSILFASPPSLSCAVPTFRSFLRGFCFLLPCPDLHSGFVSRFTLRRKPPGLFPSLFFSILKIKFSDSEIA